MTHSFTIKRPKQSCPGAPTVHFASEALHDALAYFKGAAAKRNASELHIDSLYVDVGGEA